MKRILLFTLLISFIGYSQNPIQPNTPNFEDGIPQDLVEKIKPINLEFGDDEMMDFNPNQNNNKINSQSFESSGMVQNENDYNLKLDSLIKVGIDSYGVSHKTISKFDENNNKVYEELFFWDSNNTYFEPIEIREFIYDMEGYLNQQNVFYWDLNSQSYNLNWKGDYEYDENSNQTLLLTYNWDLNNEIFIPKNKYEDSYDENGNRILRLVYEWEINEQLFIEKYKFEVSYDENGNMILIELFNWDIVNQSFVSYSIQEKSYDSNNNLIIDITYIFSSETQSHVELQKHEFSYDNNDNLILDEYYSWDTNSESFNLSWKTENDYYENGNKSSMERFNWNNDSETFTSEYKYEFNYDENNFLSNETIYRYGSLRIKMDISTFSETQTELVREGILYEYDTNFNTWNELEEELKSYWYYTKNSSLSTNSVELNSFSIYPNPTKGYLKINSSESLINPFFELYDIKGSKIFSKPFNFSEPIDVSGLKPSIYLYKIIDGNEVKHSGKLIKK